jgi:hypothetical protein
LELLFMKLFLNVNLTLTLIQIKLQFSFGEFVCLFVSILFFFTFHLTKISFLIFDFRIQRQRIDTRNSFKLSSETCWIDANVLEETTSTTSCILFFLFELVSFHFI